MLNGYEMPIHIDTLFESADRALDEYQKIIQPLKEELFNCLYEEYVTRKQLEMVDEEIRMLNKHGFSVERYKDEYDYLNKERAELGAEQKKYKERQREIEEILKPYQKFDKTKDPNITFGREASLKFMEREKAKRSA